MNVLSGEDQAFLKKLAKVHTVHLYTFNKDAREIATTTPQAPVGQGAAPANGAAGAGTDKAKENNGGVTPQVVSALQNVAVDMEGGRTTQVVPSLLTVLDNLQGQRLAGVVVITDARETPTQSPQGLIERLRRFPTKIYPVAVGSDKSPQNIDLVAVNMQDSVFKDDIVSAKVTVRASGYEPNHAVKIMLRDKKTGATLLGPEGKPAEKTITAADANPIDEELLIMPDQVGLLDVEAVAEPQPGELNLEDNVRPATVAVLDAKINVLYADGYPRWEYRYIKNEMIRDKTINISCLLTSADERFAQEGDPPIPPGGADRGSEFPGPINRFPETIEELMKYDVVLFGDVDSRQFTDRQLQLISDFVAKKGGGFGMVAGPRYAPIAYRNTPIEAVLPVNISHVAPEDPSAEYKDGWRPVITDEAMKGEASTIFRFFTDPKVNEKYLKEDLQPLFWFSQGVSVKQGVGLVYAEHPAASDPTGRKCPILVLGRFGAGRTLFSAIDDSWRWRYYTGESVFDTYWVQQLRYLARSKKLGQRRMTFVADRTGYELGERISLTLKVLDPVLLQQLPPQVRVDILDEKGNVIQQVPLIRQETPPDHYTATITAGTIGRFTARLPGMADNKDALEASYAVIVPKLELSKPELDRVMLTKLAPPEQIVQLNEAKAKLPEMIKSAAKTIPVITTQPLWNKWRALAIFVLLLTGEWVLRKVFGML
jgi:uncharacterized membrane protein